MYQAQKMANVEGGEVALVFLRLTHTSADVFPPLKSAIGGALHIIELVAVCICPLFIQALTYLCGIELQIEPKEVEYFWQIHSGQPCIPYRVPS